MRPLLVASVLLLTCLPQLAQAQWVDVASGAFADTLTGFGCAWGDHDNDGDDDLYFAILGGVNRLFRNDAGVFVEEAAGVMNDGGAGVGVAWADYDNDGDLDMYLTKYGHNKLYRNDAGAWTAVSNGNPPLNNSDSGGGVAWADYDADGDLDVYVSNFGQANVLMRNDGNDTFTDVTNAALGDVDRGEGIEWVDYDDDGDLDLYLANRGQANKLFRNDGNDVFTDQTVSPLDNAGMGQGVVWGDYDNDGDFDCYLANSYQHNRLIRNEGGGVFTDVTPALLQVTAGNSHGVAWEDFDNDGNLDLYVGNTGEPNHLFLGDGAGGFTDASPFMTGERTKGLACSDYDLDGDIDIYVVNSAEPNQLLRNDLANGNGNHWLQIDLEGTQSNLRGVGAKIEVETGTKTQVRRVSGGGGYMSMRSLTQHFGLGASTTVDQVTVYWPSGVTSVLNAVAADQRMTITEPMVSAVPNETVFHLRAHPNPATTSSSIEFRIPRASHAELVVFDAAGRRVATLLAEPREAGDHRLTWNGRNSLGRPVASGVYFCRLTAGGQTSTRRIVLVR